MNIDWSKAPEGFPVWLEDVRPLREGADRSCWAREGKGEYELHSGGWWSYSARGAQYIVHERPEWTGEGLPPVGTVCEIAASTEYVKIRYPEGTKVKVYANFVDDRGIHLAAFVDDVGQVAGVAIEKCFRPIRTPGQIAAEEREAAICAMMKVCSELPCRQSCADLYDAGYRKQVAP